MDEDKFNISVRKFLKVVGITAQREIEKAVREALSAGRLKDDAKSSGKDDARNRGVGAHAFSRGRYRTRLTTGGWRPPPACRRPHHLSAGSWGPAGRRRLTRPLS
ncbi:MAG: DUF6494 family protein [Rhodopila sp.]|nr:DUF6494 family protein [Rhodopila sp.]